ncbi:MAG: hypothetical protein COB96_05255 [Planctomycetota bacterium]|nr:MAG: hypothetical protein COB96_05255 [Planctomycetota bacterium]
MEVGHKKLEARYPQILRSALQRPGLILGTVALMGIATWMAAGKVGRELLPEVMQGEITAELYFPSGNPLSETDMVSSRIDSRLREIDGVSKSVVVSGADRESVSSNEEGPHVSRITISIEETGNRRALESQVETELRTFLAKQPEIARFELSRPTLLATKTPLEIEIISEDFAQLRKVSDQVMEELHGLPGLVDLRSSIRRGNPEVLVVLNRERLAAHNLNLSQIAARLRMAVEGEVSTTFAESDERLDVRVRADFAHMSSVEQLRDLPINPESERPLPLSAVAELHTTFGPSEILHLGSQRAAVLSGSIASNRVDLGALTTAIEEKLAQIEVPYGVELRIGGQKHEMEEALASLNFALLLAIFLVYAVMAGLFESLLQPLIIMASVPLAAIGAIWALLATGTPLSVVALLGLVVLAGIVVNNAIVLVDRINRNRDDGQELDDAILEAGKARLRPILMTTFTTVLGMLPLTGWLWFIGSAEGTELRAPMALVVIAGLLSSTMLTLVVIPVIYRGLTLLTTRTANV